MAIAYCANCAKSDSKSPAAEYQDEKYGKGQRVQTPCGKGTDVRCTVCSTVNNGK